MYERHKRFILNTETRYMSVEQRTLSSEGNAPDALCRRDGWKSIHEMDIGNQYVWPISFLTLQPASS